MNIQPPFLPWTSTRHSSWQRFRGVKQRSGGVAHFYDYFAFCAKFSFFWRKIRSFSEQIKVIRRSRALGSSVAFGKIANVWLFFEFVLGKFCLTKIVFTVQKNIFVKLQNMVETFRLKQVTDWTSGKDGDVFHFLQALIPNHPSRSHFEYLSPPCMQ